MNKKILTISLVAVAAITASVTTAFAMRKDAQVFNHYAAAENQYRYTFNKSNFSAGTYDNPNRCFPFSLSKQTDGGSTLETIDYNSSTWAGTYASVSEETDIDISKQDEILSITRTSGDAYALAIGFRICPDASFDLDSSYASYTIDEVSKTAKFSYYYDDTDGYKIYYVNPNVNGKTRSVFSLKYVYITYTC